MNRLLMQFAACAAVILALVLACGAAGGRINTSKSIPVGLYWKSRAPIGKGAYVLLCPPPQSQLFADARSRGYIGFGFCPGGYGYMMKRILAAKEDLVTVTGQGVLVNGTRLPSSAPIEVD